MLDLIDRFKLDLRWEEEDEGGWLCVVSPIMGGEEALGRTASEAIGNWIQKLTPKQP